MDILQLIEKTGNCYRKKASSQGGEFSGPCPWCGGDDRFSILPAKNHYVCRKCKKAKQFIVQCVSCGQLFCSGGGNIRRHAKTKADGCRYCYRSSKTHGMSMEKEYKTWDGMIRRCYSKKHKAFMDYGGRGICVCNEWKKSPQKFIKWARKNGFKKELELDRKNNDGDYTPENCRFVTKQINANNKRNNHRILIFEENLTISEASRKYKINKTTIQERIRRGWSGDSLIAAVCS